MSPLLILLACGGPAEDEAPWILDEETVPAGVIDQAAVQAAIDEVVEQLFQLSALPALDVYQAVVAQGDAACPYTILDTSVATGAADYWFDSCTAESGARFEGYGYYWEFSDYDAGDGTLLEGSYLVSQALVETADGSVFEGNGAAVLYEGEAADGSYQAWVSQVVGEFSWDGPGGGGWLSTELGPELTMTAYYLPDVDGAALGLDGGVFGLSGEVDMLALDGLTLYDEALGTNCGGEPGGTVSVRDGNGDWYDLVFDGPQELVLVEDESLCDGCAGVWFQGEYVGEVCADFGDLLDFRSRPW